MREKYHNRYRTKSLRLQHWNYASSGAYFITIATKEKKNYFGEILNGKMQLSQIGVIADILWYEIKNHSKNFELGEFVVMPNHIHGILVINDYDVAPVETRHALSLQRKQMQDRFQNQGKNTISSIIGGYKSAVTKHARRLGFDFQWQRNYWEHIVRDKQSYTEISNYIANNPMKWDIDKLNVESIAR